MLENIKLNTLNDIQIFNCAVGLQTCFSDFYEPDSHLTNGSLKQEFAEIFTTCVHISKTMSIASSMLNDLVRGDTHILIKIDVEGFEYEVLCGLENMIRQKRPTILIEVLPEYCVQLNKRLVPK